LSAEEITQLYSSQQITPPQPSITYVDGKMARLSSLMMVIS